MKKIIITLVCLVCLCGCTKKEFQVSELKPTTSYSGINVVSGSIKNISNNDCSIIIIYVNYKNGSIKGSDYFYIDVPKKGEIVNFDNEIINSANNILNWTNYKLSVKKIKCFMKK